MLLCPPVKCSRHEIQQPWKPGYQQLRVWQVVPAGDWCQRSAMTNDRVDRQQEQVDPSIAAHFLEELCMSERRLCTQSALGRAASEDWQARRWCGLRISCGRWAVPPHSVLTEDDAPDKPEDRSVRRFRSPVWTAPGWPPKIGTWLAVLSGGSANLLIMRVRKPICKCVDLRGNGNHILNGCVRS